MGWICYKKQGVCDWIYYKKPYVCGWIYYRTMFKRQILSKLQSCLKKLKEALRILEKSILIKQKQTDHKNISPHLRQYYGWFTKAECQMLDLHPCILSNL